MSVCVDDGAPFTRCTPHSAWQPLYSRSHSNSTRSTNEEGGLGRKEDGRVFGGGGGCLHSVRDVMVVEPVQESSNMQIHIRTVAISNADMDKQIYCCQTEVPLLLPHT